MTPQFTPPRLISFQLEGCAYAAFRRQVLAVWDTGVGKSALGIGTSCLALAEDTQLVLIICEPGKLGEWKEDTAKFATGLRPLIYHGPARARKLAAAGDINVLITTYETFRNDGASRAQGHARKQLDGPLLEWLKSRNVLVIYDEVAVLGRRGSQKYMAHQHVLLKLAKEGRPPRVLGLTATPIDTSYDNMFSVLRLITPTGMPLVKVFEKKMIAFRNPDRHYAPVWRDDGIPWFREICAPWVLRKRKTDPDVISEFPPFSEKFVMCQMREDQRALYRRIEDLAWTDGKFRSVPGLAVALRQFVGDPLALKYAQSPLGKMLWQELHGELEKCSSCKAEKLISDLEAITGNGHKAIVFTFFGQSVLRVLSERVARFQVHLYHGDMTPAEKDRSKLAFRNTPGGRILLASDAGARGINIPAPYLIEYEPARTPGLRTQRSGRAHRLGSDIPVTMMTYFTENSMEDGTAIPRLLDRNEQQDLILGDDDAENYTTAEDRREMFARARKRRIDAT